jgi:hypothetical protein
MGMSGTASAIALWLFVIILGVAFGAGLYEDRIVVPRWISSSPGNGLHWNAAAARQDDTGLRFWAYVSTGPLTLIVLVNLFAAWRSTGAVRGWWIAAVAIALAERLLTFGYFIPTMVSLMRAVDSPEAVAIASRWWTLNAFRHVLVLTAWLAALKTFAGFHR